MSNQQISLRLTALKSAGIANLQNAKREVVECLIIPIKDNHLHKNDKGDIYINLAAFKSDRLKDGKTHLVKQSLPKEVREHMTDDECKNMPILGDIKPMGVEKRDLPTYTTETNSTILAGSSDLPF